MPFYSFSLSSVFGALTPFGESCQTGDKKRGKWSVFSKTKTGLRNLFGMAQTETANRNRVFPGLKVH